MLRGRGGDVLGVVVVIVVVVLVLVGSVNEPSSLANMLPIAVMQNRFLSRMGPMLAAEPKWGNVEWLIIYPLGVQAYLDGAGIPACSGGKGFCR